jgi:hypothetical protein
VYVCLLAFTANGKLWENKTPKEVNTIADIFIVLLL